MPFIATLSGGGTGVRGAGGGEKGRGDLGALLINRRATKLICYWQ